MGGSIPPSCIAYGSGLGMASVVDFPVRRERESASPIRGFFDPRIPLLGLYGNVAAQYGPSFAVPARLLCQRLLMKVQLLGAGSTLDDDLSLHGSKRRG